MSAKVRILGVAPYSSLQSLMAKQAEKYSEIELHTVSGDLQAGLELVQKNFHSNYDIIISRGGTATLLKEKVNLPLVEIPVTYYDILRSIRLAEGIPGRKAIVGYANITKNASLLRELLQLDIDIFSVSNADEVDGLVSELKDKEYSCILCDVVVSAAARQQGLVAVLIVAGAESIDEAFRDAITLYHNLQSIRDENTFLRTVINGHKAKTVIFTEQGHLYYSSLSSSNDKLLQHLKKAIPEVLNGLASLTKTINGTLYSVKCATITQGEATFIAFYYTSTSSPLTKTQIGISFFTKGQIEREYLDSFYAITGDIENYRTTINGLNEQSKPLLVTGEEGSGKTQFIHFVFMHSVYQNRPLAEIDCERINSKAWEFLINSHHSPLYGSDNTIHFRNLEMLTKERLVELLSSLAYLGVSKRNRIIISCKSYNNQAIPESILRISNEIGCVTISLPPLREESERIPALISLYLNNLNSDLISDIIRVDPIAVDILQAYSWPGNYTQFKRLIQQLALNSSDHFIHAEDVNTMLAKEKRIIVSQPSPSPTIDITRTLSEIEEEIVDQLIRKYDGNQTAVAKQLGISRTTLWRICKRAASSSV